jgi:hypothetical protein
MMGNNYQLMMPLISLLVGIFLIGILQIRDSEKSLGTQWMVQCFFLILSLCQEALLYQVPTTLYVNGGLVLDGASSVFSISILTLSLIVHGCRLHEKRSLSPQMSLLTLCGTLFALVAVECNQLLFTVIAFLGLVWTTHGTLAAESVEGASPGESQPDLVHSGMVRGALFLFLGIILTVLCLACFGDIQADEMQRALVRGTVKVPGLFAIEIFILFLGAFMMGLPPFQGVFGKSRLMSSWAQAFGSTGIFALVGFSFLVRWGLLIFARPAIGGLEMEALTALSFLHLVRIVAAVALLLIPILSLVQRQLRGSLLFFCLNPFAQGLFAMSFGQRELMGFVLAQVLVATFSLGLLVTALHSLNLASGATFQDWVGLGRRLRAASLTILLAAASSAGIAPFFGSLLLQKTLSINSVFAFFPLLNLGLAGFCVARLIILAFHRTRPEIAQNPISLGQKFWFAAQLMALILMGIFWQPLYKYGAFSIRGFFGEL